MVWRCEIRGRDPDVLVRILASDLEFRFVEGREECEDVPVVLRLGFEFEGREEEPDAIDVRREEVGERGVEDSEYPESWRDIFIASSFGERRGVGVDVCIGV